jgi:ketosteroid isomerase-like protein
MSQETVEIVRRGYELFAAGDLEGVTALFSADAQLADAGGLGVAGTAAGTRHGPEGFLRATEECWRRSTTIALRPRTSSKPARLSLCLF